MTADRLHRQLEFVVEIDKAKSILRNSLVIEAGRRENDAEHAWHVALMALVLAEYAPARSTSGGSSRCCWSRPGRDRRGRHLCLRHRRARAESRERTRRGRPHLQSALPSEQAAALRAWCEEFEARQTPEAKFAAALDRLQPLLLNFHTQGHAWRKHKVRRSQVMAVTPASPNGGPGALGIRAGLIEEAFRLGYLAE